MNSVAGMLNRVTDREFSNQILVLTQNNWNAWKHDMQVILMHYGCWQFIIQTKPEEPDEGTTYKLKLDLQLLYRVQQIYRWKEEDFRAIKIEAKLILEVYLQLMKQDLEKAENAYLSSFTSKKSQTHTFPGATAAAHGDPSDLKPITNMKMSLVTEDKSCPVEGIGTLRFLVKPPQQSPDLNPIEHLWDYLDRQIRKQEMSKSKSFKTKNDLIKALLEEWQKIPSSVTQSLVKSVPSRLRANIKAKSYPTN
ncbi:retrovirus-related Pol polyprotein from transposon TNT 1-94 [Trichonephila clavipes]|nr:retrovirus-related Pol polyprotein from transposon TNT 1-94 [Trichonephila clavipes]